MWRFGLTSRFPDVVALAHNNLAVRVVVVTALPCALHQVRFRCDLRTSFAPSIAREDASWGRWIATGPRGHGAIVLAEIG